MLQQIGCRHSDFHSRRAKALWKTSLVCSDMACQGKQLQAFRCYEHDPATSRRLLTNFRAAGCPLLPKRTLRCCRTDQSRLFYMHFAGAKAACRKEQTGRRMRDATEREIEFAAYIGIDWAEQKHACELQSSTASGLEESELIHKPQAVEAWATELYRRFGGRPIAIALEHRLNCCSQLARRSAPLRTSRRRRLRRYLYTVRISVP